MARADFQPVLVGTDIGTYALAREFHEAWGMKPTVVTTQILGPMQNSRIIDIRTIAGQAPSGSAYSAITQGLIDLAPQLQADYPGKTLLLLTNVDSNIWDFARNKDALSPYYTCIFPDVGLLDLTADKIQFPKLVAEYGLKVPHTIHFDTHDGLEASLASLNEMDHPFPWIIKAAVSAGYERLKWPGKAKVYTAHSHEEAERIVTSLWEHTHDADNAGTFVVQPRVEGNDSFNLSVTAYIDRNGEVTMLGSAQVLLEDHHPTALGNPSAMITEPYPRLYEQVSAFLKGIKWHGFANFDFKVDSRTNEVYLFEMNPRIGRNSYYNAAAGMNPMRFYVADMIDHVSVEPEQIQRTIYYSILPKHLVLRYVDSRLGSKVQMLYRTGQAHDPMFYSVEWRRPSWRGLKRLGYVMIARMNHYRKFNRYYTKQQHEQIGLRSLNTSGLR
ncbi:MAG: carboxylate--amine ligase [Actinomycetaceae bacterium]|nr:carboxylate--amine ligase [Arcanobacterium sp.]MDD7504580.1 carboxylate--amine ligase [Actinomycetaceae bacterium]